MTNTKEIKKELREKLENDKKEREILNDKELARVQKIMIEQVIKYHSYTYGKDVKENTNNFIEHLKNNAEELNKDTEAMYNAIFQDLKEEYDKFLDIKGKNRIPELKKIFYKWKEQIDKIMKEKNIDELYAEQEFYDHLVALYYWVNEGNNFEDMFGNSEKFNSCDYLIITYDIVNDIIDAMKDCTCELMQCENDWLFGNKKIMIISSNYGNDYDEIIKL